MSKKSKKLDCYEVVENVIKISKNQNSVSELLKIIKNAQSISDLCQPLNDDESGEKFFIANTKFDNDNGILCLFMNLKEGTPARFATDVMKKKNISESDFIVEKQKSNGYLKSGTCFYINNNYLVVLRNREMPITVIQNYINYILSKSNNYQNKDNIISFRPKLSDNPNIKKIRRIELSHDVSITERTILGLNSNVISKWIKKIISDDNSLKDLSPESLITGTVSLNILELEDDEKRNIFIQKMISNFDSDNTIFKDSKGKVIDLGKILYFKDVRISYNAFNYPDKLDELLKEINIFLGEI